MPDPQTHCIGCLSPGEGRIADYIARPAKTNDPHAFGPVMLAFGSAAQLARPGWAGP